jgi:hypothetical protein
VYIKTANDRALKPEQQEAMIRRWPARKETTVLSSLHQTVSWSSSSTHCDLLIKLSCTPIGVVIYQQTFLSVVHHNNT